MSDVVTGEELKRRVLKYAAEAINLGAAKVMSVSVDEAPLGPGGGDNTPGALRESASVDPATPEHLWAVLSYSTPYAAAQHEGWALQHRHGEEVLWVVKHYTTPGTKKKFLEDPHKAFIPQFEPFMANHIRRRLTEGGVAPGLADSLGRFVASGGTTEFT